MPRFLQLPARRRIYAAADRGMVSPGAQCRD